MRNRRPWRGVWGGSKAIPFRQYFACYTWKIILQVHWAGRLGEGQRWPRSGGKPWPGSLRSDFSLVWGIPGAQGYAGAHPGAVRERFGELSELRNRLSGSFRSSKSRSQSPLSDSFGDTFDFKSGRSSAERKRFAEALVLYCHDGAKLVFSGVGGSGRRPSRIRPLPRKSASGA